MVDELRRLDTELRVCGAASHRYQFSPPLKDAEIDAFERRFGICLPDEYQRFLVEVANGGAGPNYGLKSLADATKGCDPSKPFPSTGMPLEEPVGSFDYDMIPGALWLTDNGCGTTDNLIVNGMAYGRVWTVLDERDYCRALSFGAWYMRWLTSAIRTIKREPLIQEIKKGMTLDAVREILGMEVVPHAPQKTLNEDYWLAFPDCNACLQFSFANRVVRVDHMSHTVWISDVPSIDGPHESPD